MVVVNHQPLLCTIWDSLILLQNSSRICGKVPTPDINIFVGAGRGRGRSIRLLFHLVLTKSPCSFLVGRSKPKALHFSSGRSNFSLRLRSTPPSAIRHPSGGRFATTALPPHSPHPPTQSIDHPGQIRTRTEVDKTQTAHYQQKTCPFLATFEREREREHPKNQVCGCHHFIRSLCI